MQIIMKLDEFSIYNVDICKSCIDVENEYKRKLDNILINQDINLDQYLNLCREINILSKKRQLELSDLLLSNVEIDYSL